MLQLQQLQASQPQEINSPDMLYTHIPANIFSQIQKMLKQYKLITIEQAQILKNTTIAQTDDIQQVQNIFENNKCHKDLRQNLLILLRKIEVQKNKEQSTNNTDINNNNVNKIYQNRLQLQKDNEQNLNNQIDYHKKQVLNKQNTQFSDNQNPVSCDSSPEKSRKSFNIQSLQNLENNKSKMVNQSPRKDSQNTENMISESEEHDCYKSYQSQQDDQENSHNIKQAQNISTLNQNVKSEFSKFSQNLKTIQESQPHIQEQQQNNNESCSKSVGNLDYAFSKHKESLDSNSLSPVGSMKNVPIPRRFSSLKVNINNSNFTRKKSIFEKGSSIQEKKQLLLQNKQDNNQQ